MAELWFIRHFRTPWNSQGRLQGQRDISLDDPLGPADLATLEANRQALSGRDFGLVLTSPLVRARQTAALHGFSDATVEPDLAELAFGKWEGRTWAELEAAHPGAWKNSLHSLPLGESLADFTDRIDRVRNRVQTTTPGIVLAFGHGAWLGGLKLLLEGRKGGMPPQILANGALVRLHL